MLILPIKKKWFDMILLGEKKEEYREIKPYYTTRFLNSGHLKQMVDVLHPEKEPEIVNNGSNRVIFRNGYSNDLGARRPNGPRKSRGSIWSRSSGLKKPRSPKQIILMIVILTQKNSQISFIYKDF